MLRLSGLLALLALPASALGTPDAAEHAYQAAGARYHALKRDTAQRKFRHSWLRVAQGFERVAESYPKSGRAPDALFNAAETLQELSRISLRSEDLQSAIDDYQKLVQAYPHHHLADDAALSLAKIQVDRLNRPEVAKKTLRQAISQNPKGDRIGEMRSLLKALNRESSEKSRIARSASRPRTAELASVRHAPADWKAKAFAAALNQPEPPAREMRAPTRASFGAAQEHRAPPTITLKLDSSAAAVAAEDSPAARDPGQQESSAKVVDPSRDSPTPQPPAPHSQMIDAKAALALLPEHTEYPLSQQLGLKVRRVVVDAGHGGHDTGAIGRGGTREKDVALAIALRLREVLARAGLEVILTRDDDSFVPLEERARRANESKGDLFVSIHCNSAPGRRLHGIETYTLNTASDRYSIRLAARENASSEKRISDLQFILADLATKANTEESLRLAGQVHTSLVDHLRHRHSDIHDLGTKQALFYVLLGVKMPAILVETSFLSNGEEERRLASKPYQSDAAEAIATGIQDFLGNRQKVARVD
jgi:N-acetylmuramoyl-L-alanine amidase